MVWEQGSVVIVNLSKLAENGDAMCHRYWPEEGSDLYHIYEVGAGRTVYGGCRTSVSMRLKYYIFCRPWAISRDLDKC